MEDPRSPARHRANTYPTVQPSQDEETEVYTVPHPQVHFLSQSQTIRTSGGLQLLPHPEERPLPTTIPPQSTNQPTAEQITQEQLDNEDDEIGESDSDSEDAGPTEADIVEEERPKRDRLRMFCEMQSFIHNFLILYYFVFKLFFIIHDSFLLVSTFSDPNGELSAELGEILFEKTYCKCSSPSFLFSLICLLPCS